jgi:Holliday junction resolvase RusA-like endonuclease
MLSFFISGEPAPQGSKTAKCINGKAIMWESSPKLKVWRQLVHIQTLNFIKVNKIEKYCEQIAVDLVFHLPRPKSVNRLRPSVKPDLDKLIRSTCDGLKTGGLFQDDALIIEIHAEKYYADTNSMGCHIGVKSV